MRLRVIQKRCQGHNRCHALAPELFEPDEYGSSRAVNDGVVPAELEGKGELAFNNCPEFAIERIDEGDGRADMQPPPRANREQQPAVKTAEAVRDWSSDCDIFHPSYIRDPVPIWRALRVRCPISRTERWGGSWLSTRYADVRAMVHMVPELSSRDPLVMAPPEELFAEGGEYGLNTPPITSDPPDHLPMRRLILPFFTPKAVAQHRVFTTELCHRLIDSFEREGWCDAAADYARQIPPRVIAHMLGVDLGRADQFVEWARGVLEIELAQPEERLESRTAIRQFFAELVAERRQRPGDDLISAILAQQIDGERVPDHRVVGICYLLLVAGIDTTWSAISAAFWHLGTHSEHRRRLARQPELVSTATEELLRVYAPVTMARVATEEVTMGEVTFQPGDKVLLNFPAANLDPEAFEYAEEVVLDREHNRHIAFGLGIHRCAGANLARMEMNVALRAWFERIPEFEVQDPDAVAWSGGQVRGPRTVPVRWDVKDSVCR